MNRLKTLTLAVFLLGSFAASAADPSASDVAQKSYDSSRVADSTSDATFTLVNSKGEKRIRETTGETKLIKGTTDNMRITTFMSPSDVKGTKTLLIEHTGKDDDIWIYLPALKKVRRLVSNNKKDPFVGTDFSYGDVIGHRPSDWNHKIIKSESVDGRDCFVLESTPKTPEVADNSGYSKRVSWIDKENFVPLKGEVYESGNQLLKKFTSKGIEKVDAKNDKWQPMYLEAENVQTDHRTILEFRNFKANVGIGDDKFTTRYLEIQ
jgi:outer membrane lipoprotein-sorting protein